MQREEFKRLGVVGDWDHPYSTMDFASEAIIAREIMKFAENGLLYRGSKPVMWSVVEKTALAEAEVEYDDYTSDTVWVAFPVKEIDPTFVEVVGDADQIKLLRAAKIVIWTTTPWTIPGNRAISYSSKLDVGYGLYEIVEAFEKSLVKQGELLIIANNLAEAVLKQAKASGRLQHEVSATELSLITCAHPLHKTIPQYDFDVPLFDGDHVTDDAGTGFVHTAPGHGREDFDIWMRRSHS